mgnify:CR=1 FL=1
MCAYRGGLGFGFLSCDACVCSVFLCRFFVMCLLSINSELKVVLDNQWDMITAAYPSMEVDYDVQVRGRRSWCVASVWSWSRTTRVHRWWHGCGSCTALTLPRPGASPPPPPPPPLAHTHIHTYPCDNICTWLVVRTDNGCCVALARVSQPVAESPSWAPTPGSVSAETSTGAAAIPGGSFVAVWLGVLIPLLLCVCTCDIAGTIGAFGVLPRYKVLSSLLTVFAYGDVVFGIAAVVAAVLVPDAGDTITSLAGACGCGVCHVLVLVCLFVCECVCVCVCVCVWV